jgi:hypothetical protein
MPVIIPAFGRLKQEDLKFGASWSYTARFYCKKKKLN